MEQRVGSCSLCGGAVYGYRGAWMSVSPPPPDRCTSCYAVSISDVIPMTPSPDRRATKSDTLTVNTPDLKERR